MNVREFLPRRRTIMMQTALAQHVNGCQEAASDPPDLVTQNPGEWRSPRTSLVRRAEACAYLSNEISLLAATSR